MLENDIEWRFSQSPVDYMQALSFMESRIDDIHALRAPECLWFLEHPSLFTAGISASQDELLLKDELPVYHIRRGGRYTYHGPGQRLVYVMLDLRKRNNDIRRLVRGLEEWIIASLAEIDIHAERRKDRIGIWIPATDKTEEKKIAAIGVQVRRWISFHGIAINLSPNLSYFEGIVPCGIHDYGVTSLQQLGAANNVADLDEALKRTFPKIADLQAD